MRLFILVFFISRAYFSCCQDFDFSNSCIANRKYLQKLFDDFNDSEYLTFKSNDICIDSTLTLRRPLNIDFGNSKIFVQRELSNNLSFFDIFTFENIKDTIFIKNIEINGSILLDTTNIDSKFNNKFESSRFSGISVKNCKNIYFSNILVKGTINAEHYAQVNPAAAFFVSYSSNIHISNSVCSSNFGTGFIFFESKYINLSNVMSFDNIGSGISLSFVDSCFLNNLILFNNNNKIKGRGKKQNYSNLSLNGDNIFVENVISYGSDASGINIGHDSNQNFKHHDKKMEEIYRKRKKSVNINIINAYIHTNDLFGISIKNSNKINLKNIISFNNNKNLFFDKNVTEINIESYFENINFNKK